MKVVVADTSPLNYLVLVGAVDVLPRLFARVLIPEAVLAELESREAPAPVSQWAASLPAWVDVLPVPEVTDQALEELDTGERAAIVLAQLQPQAVLLLIDDARGREEAERRHIPTTGTLGVLRAAAIRDLVDLPAAFARLRGTNFRSPVALLDELLAEDAERKRTSSAG